MCLFDQRRSEAAVRAAQQSLRLERDYWIHGSIIWRDQLISHYVILKNLVEIVRNHNLKESKT